MDIEISDHDDNEDVVVHGALSAALGPHVDRALLSASACASHAARSVQCGVHRSSAQRQRTAAAHSACYYLRAAVSFVR